MSDNASMVRLHVHEKKLLDMTYRLRKGNKELYPPGLYVEENTNQSLQKVITQKTLNETHKGKRNNNKYPQDCMLKVSPEYLGTNRVPAHTHGRSGGPGYVLTFYLFTGTQEVNAQPISIYKML